MDSGGNFLSNSGGSVPRRRRRCSLYPFDLIFEASSLPFTDMEACGSRLCPNSRLFLLPNFEKSLLSPSSLVRLRHSIHLADGLSRKAPSRSASLKGFLVQSKSSEEKVGDLVFDHGNSVIALKKKKLAVFVSGGGSNFRSIHEACLGGMIHGEIAVLVTNKRDCGGAVYARDRRIQVLVFPSTKGDPDSLSASDLVTTLRSIGIDFVVLAGYLKLIPPQLIQAYPKSILNIHPSLLPAFGGKGYYGMKVHKAVIASGARYSGPTIHFVDEHYDTGRILAQSAVPVLPTDTAEELAARVLKEEHRLYVDVVAALCEERIVWREDGVPLIRSKDNANEYL